MNEIRVLFEKPDGARRLLEITGDHPRYRIAMTYCNTGKVSELVGVSQALAFRWFERQGQSLVSRGFMPV